MVSLKLIHCVSSFFKVGFGKEPNRAAAVVWMWNDSVSLPHKRSLMCWTLGHQLAALFGKLYLYNVKHYWRKWVTRDRSGGFRAQLLPVHSSTFWPDVIWPSPTMLEYVPWNCKLEQPRPLLSGFLPGVCPSRRQLIKQLSLEYPVLARYVCFLFQEIRRKQRATLSNLQGINS